MTSRTSSPALTSSGTATPTGGNKKGSAPTKPGATTAAASGSAKASSGGAPAKSASTEAPPAASKPSTPSAPSSTGAQLPDLSQMLNLPLRVAIAPLAGETGGAKSVEGALFTYDSSFVVLASPESTAHARPTTPNLGASKGAGDSAGPRRTFTFLRTSQISSVTVLSPSPTDTSLPASDVPLPALPSSSVDLSARVERAVAEDRRARARLAPSGTSPEAQGLFDALAKTLPVRWAGTSIVVLDEVVIESPYEPHNVKGAKGSADRVERIKKMVEGLRARLGMGSPAVQVGS